MKREGKLFHPLWIALTAVALAGVIVFSVFIARAVRAGNESGELPVSVPSDAAVALYAEDEDTFVYATDAGEIVSVSKGADEENWRYGGTGERVTALGIYGGTVYVTAENRRLYRFAAEGNGEPAGVLTLNLSPLSFAFPEQTGDFFAVYCKTQQRHEINLVSLNFGGSAAEPESYKSYPKLDTLASNGGIELGVQGIYVTDGYVYVSSDAYTVRRFTRNGMADPFEEYSIAAEKLAAFSEAGEGFAGIDLKGNYYRFDDTFQILSSVSLGRNFERAMRAGNKFYGVSSESVTCVSAEEGALYTFDTGGASLIAVSQSGFGLAENGTIRCYDDGLAADIAAYASKLPLFIALTVVFAIFLLYAGASVCRPVRQRVNGVFKLVGSTFVKHRFAYLGLIPAFVLLGVFYYWPIVKGFALSFFNYNGVVSEFVGFDNFIAVLHNKPFWSSTGNMFILLATDLLKALIPPFFFAEFILAVRAKKFSFAVRVLLFIPGILPGVAGTLVWLNGIFGSDSYGLLNSICSIFVPGFTRMWIGPEVGTSLFVLIMFGFSWVGSYLIFYGGITGISTSLFEAADLDGCGWARRLATIDIPLIFAQLKYIFITSFISSVQDYGRLFITNQEVHHGLKIPALIIYEFLYNGGEPNYGLSSAMSLFIFAFLLVATILNFRKNKEDAAA